jgi:AAA domain
MPHLRKRHALGLLQKLLAFWPVTAIVGPRQCGKSTLARAAMPPGTGDYTFDDYELRAEAKGSIKSFVSRLKSPAIIDEVQKVPIVFDELKRVVDRKKVPGSYLITGSSSFSDQAGIRESLTGRIGILRLHPLTWAERNELSQAKLKFECPWKIKSARASVEAISQDLALGGMPVPAFTRAEEQRDLYWNSWLETTLYRDIARLFKRNYDPDIAFSILRQIGKALIEGELPTLKHFKEPAALVKRYLSSMEMLFLVQRYRCHPSGIGTDAWLLMDPGVARFIMKTENGVGVTLSLVRHFLWNEWRCHWDYQGKRLEQVYYKSAQGSPIDLIWGDIPIRILASLDQVTSRLSWEERPLRGVMKKLESPFGILVAPVEKFTPPEENEGVGLVPWGSWC